jgi:hypothetical protein|nr:MAG TPA: hypothetical protein [Caudoviricetes sp.]
MQGFYFCPAARKPHTSVYSGLFAAHAIIPQQRKKRLQSFTVVFPLILSIPAHTIQQPHKPPIHHLRHAEWHTVKRSTFTNTQISPPYRTLSRSAQPLIIIRYIMVQRRALVIDPCQTVQHIANHASPAMCRYFPRLAAGVLAWVSLALCFFLARRRGTLDGYRRISFRAFAR